MTGRPPMKHPAEWYLDVEETVDASLQLLDRQLIDPDGVPVSAVDDLDLAGCETGADVDHDHPVTVGGLLVGTSLLTRIFGGRMPRSRRDRIAWRDIDRIGTVIRLRVHADDVDVTWPERWLRERVIGRIPGGRDAPQ